MCTAGFLRAIWRSSISLQRLQQTLCPGNWFPKLEDFSALLESVAQDVVSRPQLKAPAAGRGDLRGEDAEVLPEDAEGERGRVTAEQLRVGI